MQNMAAFTIGYQNGYSDAKKANSPGGKGYAAAYKNGLMKGMQVQFIPGSDIFRLSSCTTPQPIGKFRAGDLALRCPVDSRDFTAHSLALGVVDMRGNLECAHVRLTAVSLRAVG